MTISARQQPAKACFYYTGKVLLKKIEPTLEQCILTAKSHGNTVAQARNCILGRVGCPDCPFAKYRSQS